MYRYHRIAIGERNSYRFNSRHNKGRYYRAVVSTLKSVIIASRKQFKAGKDKEMLLRALSHARHIAQAAHEGRLNSRMAINELKMILIKLEKKENSQASKSMPKAA